LDNQPGLSHDPFPAAHRSCRFCQGRSPDSWGRPISAVVRVAFPQSALRGPQWLYRPEPPIHRCGDSAGIEPVGLSPASRFTPPPSHLSQGAEHLDATSLTMMSAKVNIHGEGCDSIVSRPPSKRSPHCSGPTLAGVPGERRCAQEGCGVAARGRLRGGSVALASLDAVRSIGCLSDRSSNEFVRKAG
jgi:hypothetical protein